MIKDTFLALGPWAWIILGLVLLVLEIVAPGTMFLWFGVAALLVGGLSFVVDPGWQNALILFGVLSLISVIVGRMLLNRYASKHSDQPLLNQRGKALIGNVYHLDEPIENGQGRLRIQDSYWRIKGPDCPSGTRVRITGADGPLLDVAPE